MLLDLGRGKPVTRPASVLAVGLVLTCLGVVPAAAHYSFPTVGTGRRVLSEAAPGTTTVRAEVAGPLHPGSDTRVIVQASGHGSESLSAGDLRIHPLPGRGCPEGAVRVVVRGTGIFLRVAADAPNGCQGATVTARLVSGGRS